MSSTSSKAPASGDMRIFLCCWMALITTSFGFIVRAFSIGDWGTEFGLSATQQGEIFGVGLWPFAISIVIFSLIIDRIGYKIALYFAFACHLISGIMTLKATGYNSLWWATFIVALGNGTVEAVINPVVATMFNKDKAKWLNILHAAWPGGLALAGILALPLHDWHTKVLLIFVPTILYGLMLIPIKFPVNERVAAGVSDRDMLKEVGGFGMFIVLGLIFSQIFALPAVGSALNIQNPLVPGVILAAIAGIIYGFIVKDAGRPLFSILLLIMIPLATTELGVDSWVTALMAPVMGKYAGWLLVYTSVIMTVLRLFAGPLLHKFSPIGLLAICSVLAAAGIFTLSKAAGIGILVAATLYGIAKSFFWPTMLAIVSERFPKGGALALNAQGGVGMLGVGVIGAVLLGSVQDHSIATKIKSVDASGGTALYSTYVTAQKTGIFGSYIALDQSKVASAPAAEQAIINEATSHAKLDALSTVALLPVLMFLSYLGLILYFRSSGGYKPVSLESESVPNSKSPEYSKA